MCELSCQESLHTQAPSLFACIRTGYPYCDRLRVFPGFLNEVATKAAPKKLEKHVSAPCQAFPQEVSSFRDKEWKEGLTSTAESKGSYLTAVIA